jgi:hypothetical protein
MSTDIIQPNRNQPVIRKENGDFYMTIRVAEFYDQLVKMAADLPNQGAAVTDAAVTASDITITWTTNEPTSSTEQTIANGNSPTAAETGQAIANIVAQINKLQDDVTTNKNKINELISSLETANLIAT